MPKSPITYNKFITDDFSIIKDEFEQQGFPIESENDFSTYVGWKEQGRVVKRGEKGTPITSTKPYAHPVFHYGGIRVDEFGKKQFRKYHHDFTLFHKEQTKQIEKKEVVKNI